MAPKLPISSRSSLWSRLDASKPKLSLRDLFDENEPTSQGLSTVGTALLAFGVLTAFLILGCYCLALCKNKKPFAPATLPPPIQGDDRVDPAPLQPSQPPPKPMYRASIEMEMRALERPTSAGVGALGWAGY
jgi:hypothetical protein